MHNAQTQLLPRDRRSAACFLKGPTGLGGGGARGQVGAAGGAGDRLKCRCTETRPRSCTAAGLPRVLALGRLSPCVPTPGCLITQRDVAGRCPQPGRAPASRNVMADEDRGTSPRAAAGRTSPAPRRRPTAPGKRGQWGPLRRPGSGSDFPSPLQRPRPEQGDAWRRQPGAPAAPGRRAGRESGPHWGCPGRPEGRLEGGGCSRAQDTVAV